MRWARLVLAVAPAALVAVAISPGCGVVVGVPDHTQAQHTDPSSLACQKGYGDCNGDIDDGCETDLATDAHCGACNVSCGFGSCVEGACTCSAHYDNCDKDATNGCETSLDYDAKNCGGCDIDCSPGACLAGHCQPAQIVGLDFYYTQLDFTVQDDKIVYGFDGGIYSAPIDSPTPTQGANPIFPTGESVLTFRIDGDRVTWAQWNIDTVNGALYTGSMSGGAPLKLVDFDSQLAWGEMSGSASNGFVTDATSAYYVNQTFNGATTELHKVALDGSGDTTISSLAVADQGGFVWTGVDQGKIFWMGPKGLVVYDPATAMTQTKQVLDPDQIFIVSNGKLCGPAYGSFGSDLTIECGQEDGTSFVKMADFPFSFATSIAVDGADVFAADGDTQRIFGSESGGAAVKLAVSEGELFKLVVSGGDVYWASAVGIYRLRHPFGK